MRSGYTGGWIALAIAVFFTLVGIRIWIAVHFLTKYW